MKKLNDIIQEKLRINKDTIGKYMFYDQFLNGIQRRFKLSKENIDMLNDKLVESKFLKGIDKYKFFWLKIEENYSKFEYKFIFDTTAELLNHPHSQLVNDALCKLIITYDSNDLYVYTYKNVNLSNDDGDEYYIFFIDHENDKIYVYQLVDDKYNKAIVNK